MAKRLVAFALGLLVLAGACSGDDDSNASGGESGQTSAEAAPTEPASSAPDDTSGATTTAAATTTSSPPAEAELSVATLNVLHGIFCPEETDGCRAPERIDAVWRFVEQAGCPDVVGLQEIGPRQTELVPATLPDVCDGAYQLLFDPEGQGQPADQEMILTSLPVVDDGYVELAEIPWGAHWARLELDDGQQADVITTHFASSANNPDCDEEKCPPSCQMGVEVGQCHPVEVLAFLDALDGSSLALVTGDLNAPIDNPRIETLTDAGFEDAWLLAGNAECDPETGDGCTCCLDDEPDATVYQQAQPASRFDGRIDFVLARPAPGCELSSDAVPFAASALDEPVGETYWASDHGGVMATLRLQCS